jgi:inhibitor of KinA sporulation pathway (predicted exonuclease)
MELADCAATHYHEKIIGIRQKSNETMRAFNARFRTLLRRLREASPDAFSGKAYYHYKSNFGPPTHSLSQFSLSHFA